MTALTPGTRVRMDARLARSLGVSKRVGRVIDIPVSMLNGHDFLAAFMDVYGPITFCLDLEDVDVLP